jgi:NADPH-dependent 2,4-dienoyl-CoA reductase/sulfur reductase-like enzyme
MFNPKFNPSHFFPIVQPFVTAIYLLTMSTKSYPHVLVVGAGMSGLTLAHQLKTANISFSIFERDPTSDARTQGWALSLFGPALADLVESMPEEMGPVDQTSHLLPLDLPAQFVFYDITF